MATASWERPRQFLIGVGRVEELPSSGRLRLTSVPLRHSVNLGHPPKGYQLTMTLRVSSDFGGRTVLFNGNVLPRFNRKLGFLASRSPGRPI